jgi:hypothetical protein
LAAKLQFSKRFAAAKRDARLQRSQMNGGAMNWDDLRVFLAVARAEGLSGAARGLAA